MLVRPRMKHGGDRLGCQKRADPHSLSGGRVCGLQRSRAEMPAQATYQAARVTDPGRSRLRDYARVPLALVRYPPTWQRDRLAALQHTDFYRFCDRELASASATGKAPRLFDSECSNRERLRLVLGIVRE